jgi:DNA-binding LacI/PurR family transcriptional regulator
MDNFSPSQNMVAKAAGVSRSTVSRVFSNHPGIPAETKRHVRQIAEKMGYRKNAIVSMLTAQVRTSRLKKTESTLAYITSQSTPKMLEISPTYYQFYLGARERAEELGYGLDVIWRRESMMTAGRITKILQSRGIRGIILAPRPKTLGHVSLDWRLFAAASIGHALPLPRINYAGASHFAIIDKALRVLRKYGYRRVGYSIFPDADGYSNHAFVSRYCMHRSMLPPKDQIPFYFDPVGQESSTRAQFKRWLQKYRPDAVLAVGPDVGFWLDEIGDSIPDKVAHVDLCLPDESGEVAGVFEMPKVIAATAVELVVEQLHHNAIGVPEHPKSVLFDGKWVDGKTLPTLSRIPPARQKFPVGSLEGSFTLGESVSGKRP